MKINIDKSIYFIIIFFILLISNFSFSQTLDEMIKEGSNNIADQIIQLQSEKKISSDAAIEFAEKVQTLSFENLFFVHSLCSNLVVQSDPNICKSITEIVIKAKNDLNIQIDYLRQSFE